MLSADIDMKDLEKDNVIVGIKITRIKRDFFGSIPLIEKILKKYNYFDSKPACTPHKPSVKLFKNIGNSVNQSEYVSIIDSLTYVVDCTRP